MKKYVAITMVFVTTSAAFALLVTTFTGWADLIDKSPDIIIARCTATQDFLTPKPKSFFSNVFSSDIEVISVLKGNTKSGPSHMTSLYFPYRGEYFLVFATSFKNETNLIYGATEEYRVVPLKHFNGTNGLAGKPLDEQIRLLLKSRLDDLNDELARDSAEKSRIEMGLKINGQSSALSNSLPSEQMHPKGAISF